MTRVPIALILFCGMVLADHLPENLVARGKAENMLSGIDVYRSRVSDLLERLGKPVTYDKYPKTEEAAEIVWDKAGSKIHATINIDDIAYAVTVSGKPSAITTTGRGLGLGQTVADVKRIYGNRLMKRGNRVIVQWQDGTEMRALFANSRIISLTLIAAVE
jgi:hypothetical protein